MKQPFEQAVAQHGATVLRLCRAVLGPGADADDAWSDTFLAALEAWTELAADTNVEAWLVRVAHRKAIDITRRRSRQAVPTAHLPDPPVAAEPLETGVWEAVAALPERQRLAVAYHYFGGLPHVETAKLLDSTPAAVRRAAADGLNNLRKIYPPPKHT